MRSRRVGTGLPTRAAPEGGVGTRPGNRERRKHLPTGVLQVTVRPPSKDDSMREPSSRGVHVGHYAKAQRPGPRELRGWVPTNQTNKNSGAGGEGVPGGRGERNIEARRGRIRPKERERNGKERTGRQPEHKKEGGGGGSVRVKARRGEQGRKTRQTERGTRSKQSGGWMVAQSTWVEGTWVQGHRFNLKQASNHRPTSPTL